MLACMRKGDAQRVPTVARSGNDKQIVRRETAGSNSLKGLQPLRCAICLLRSSTRTENMTAWLTTFSNAPNMLALPLKGMPLPSQINMRGKIRPEMRARHATAPQFVQWHSGVLLPKGARLTNGTWSPRYEW